MSSNTTAKTVITRKKQLGLSLLRLAARVQRLQLETLQNASVPLSLRQYRILERVHNGETSITALAELAKRRPSTISKSVESLVRQGLLVRQPSAFDRRALTLEVTPSGTAVLREMDSALGDLALWLVEDLNDTSAIEFLDSLYRRAEPLLQTDLEAGNSGQLMGGYD